MTDRVESSTETPPAADPGRTIQSTPLEPGQAATATLARAMRYEQPLTIETRCGVPAEVLVEVAKTYNPAADAHDAELVISVQPSDPLLPATSVKLIWREPIQDPALSRPPGPGEMKVRRDSMGRILTIEQGPKRW